jgi:hypothetical protein
MMGGFGMAEMESGSANGGATEDKKPPKLRLTLRDRETGETRFCTLDEAKTWDWENPEVWRMIGDWQITSYKGLLEVLSLKIENGHREVEILVAPRFTMLSGG